MTAPALIALAHGSRDPRSAATIAALVDEVRALRPDLRIEAAFLDLCDPSLDTVVDTLAGEGHREVVVVPLFLTEAVHATVDVPDAVRRAAQRHDHLALTIAPILGIENVMFRVLDERLRAALRLQRVHELDALVLAGAGSSDPAANAQISRAARAWGQVHHLPVVAAFASAAPPAAGEAVRALRADGRRHIAVAQLMLAPGFLPDRVKELAYEAGAVAVAEPLGAHEEIAQLVLARYSVGALDLVPLEAMFG